MSRPACLIFLGVFLFTMLSSAGLHTSPEMVERAKIIARQTKALKTIGEKRIFLEKARDELIRDRNKLSDELNKLKKDQIEKEKKISKAKQANKDQKSQISALDERETQVIRLWLAFELIFEDVLSKEFEEDPHFKNKTCLNLPNVVKFQELANQPQGATLSQYRQIALEVLADICGASSSVGGTPKHPPDQHPVPGGGST